jgi:cephalosporin hydroxylase
MSVRERLYGELDPYGKVEATAGNDHGWASDTPIFQELIDELKPQLIVEIGSWMGRSARHMARLGLEHHPQLEIVCVDTWLGSVEHWLGAEKSLLPGLYDQFRYNVVLHELQATITPFRIDSINAGHWFSRSNIQPDLIYIDAGHEYESIKQDLQVWAPILRSGGILFLDDAHYEPIQRAAHECLGELPGKDNKLIWRKP